MSFLYTKPNTNPPKLVVIKSENRLPPSQGIISTPSHFTINMPDNIKSVKQVSIASVNIPYMWDNIDITNNKIIIEIQNGAPITYTVIPGSYNIFSLCDAITSMLGVNDFSVSFNLNTKKVTFINKNSDNFFIRFNGLPNNLHKILGFDNIDYGPFSIIEAPYCAKIIDTDALLIKCPTLIAKNGTDIFIPGNTDSYIMGYVPVNVNPGDIIMNNLSWMLTSSVNYTSKQIKSLEIILTKENNDDGIDLNGQEWIMCLYVFSV
jgi:hypothetical protein